MTQNPELKPQQKPPLHPGSISKETTIKYPVGLKPTVALVLKAHAPAKCSVSEVTIKGVKHTAFFYRTICGLKMYKVN